MRLQRFPHLIALLLALLLLAACGAGSDPVPPTTTPEPPTNTPEPVPTDTPEPAATETPVPEPTVEPTATTRESTLEDAQAATVQVLVQGSQFLEEFIGSGSGVIYSEEGFVVTNNHVVEGGAIIQVLLEGRDDPISARVLGKSPCDDLAVLELPGTGYPAAELGAELSVGDDVFAIGYPLGDPTQGTTKGIVSKTSMAVPTDFADYLDAIQTDAAINPGNSGGPLVTRNGRVVGINSAGLDMAQGTNFAISMDYAFPIIERLQEGENINWIGVNAAPLPAEFAESFGIALEPGLFVYAVDSGSPADITGLQEGDFITSIEGISIGADGTLKTFCDVLRSHRAGDVLDIGIIREGARFAGQVNGRELEGGESVALGGGVEDATNEGEEPLAPNDIVFADVTDNTGRITLQLPAVWEVDSGDLVIHAAEDINAWFDGFGGSGEGAATTSGFYITAGDQDETVDMTTVEEFLDGTAVPANCEFSAEDRGDYDDGVYRGLYDVMACDEGEYVTLIAYDPESPTFLIWIEAYLLTDRDVDIFGNALDTFFVTP